MVWWQILLIGFLIGVFCTSYVTVAWVRDHLHSGIGGLFKGSGKAQKPKTNGKKAERLETCVVCGKASPVSELTDATVTGTKAKVWIHPSCHERTE